VRVFTTRTQLKRLGRRRGVLIGLLVVVVLALGVIGLAAVGGGGEITDHGLASAPEAGLPASRGGAAGRDAAGATTESSAAAAGGGVAGSAPQQAGSPTAADPGAVPVGGVARSLVRTAQLTVEADDPVAVTRRVRTAVAGVAGTVAQETSSDSGAQLTVRVPADRLDQLIDTIGGFGHVTSRSAQVVDATEDVVDLDARVASQRASVDRVRALLAQARSIGDVVSIESELTRREADLDSLTGRLAALRDQVALSTLTVDLEKGPVTTGPNPEPTGFLAGLAAGWDGLKAVGVGAGAVVGYVLPFVPVLAVILGLVWVGRRVARARRRPAGGAEQPGI
jgi:Domain of unknown function (DUF4349)